MKRHKKVCKIIALAKTAEIRDKLIEAFRHSEEWKRLISVYEQIKIYRARSLLELENKAWFLRVCSVITPSDLSEEDQQKVRLLSNAQQGAIRWTLGVKIN